MDDQARIDSVLGGARNPLNWLARGLWLYRSALVLEDAHGEASRKLHFTRWWPWDQSPSEAQFAEWEDAYESSMGYGVAAMLLRAFAIENLIKGLLIVKDPEKWAPRPPSADKPIFKWKHRLTELADDGEMKLTDEERQVCELLTVFIEWGGRYPSAQQPSKQGPQGVRFTDHDVEVIKPLYERLYKELSDASGLKPR